MGETLLHRGAALSHIASVSRTGLLRVLLVSDTLDVSDSRLTPLP